MTKGRRIRFNTPQSGSSSGFMTNHGQPHYPAQAWLCVHSKKRGKALAKSKRKTVAKAEALT